MARLFFPKIKLDTTVKGVLIDIDDTLYSYQEAHKIALKKTYAVFSQELTCNFSKVFIVYDDFKKLYREARDKVTKRLKPQGACRSRLFAFQLIFEELHLPSAFNHALKYEKIYWEMLIKKMQRDEDAYSFLVQCCKNNIPVCAVSDMQAHFQIQKLQKLNLDYLINFLVTSEEVGVEKPDAGIFYHALNKLALNPSDVIMIGDSEEKDMKGAQSIGIRAFKVEHIA